MLKLGEYVPARRQFEGYSCETFKDPKTGGLRLASANIFNKTSTLDISWLPLAAEKYQISPDIRDYIIAEIPIVSVDVPNRNMDCFPFSSVTEFSTTNGCIAYNTFRGKPTHKEHDNKDPRKAKGFHIDAQLEKQSSGLYKIVVLTAWDRTKDREIAQRLLSNEKCHFSMGCFVEKIQCPVENCLAISSNGQVPCRHLNYGKNKGQVINGQLIYEVCVGDLTYCETSIVTVAADFEADDRWRSPWG